MVSKDKSKGNKRLGWHFLPSSRTLGFNDGRTVHVGKTLSMKDTSLTPSVCNAGMHASDQPSEAAVFKKGPVLSRVEVWGDISSASGKFCGRHRKVVWMRELLSEDIKALCAAVGCAIYGVRAAGVEDISHAVSQDCNKFDKWVLAWAKRNGQGSIEAPKPRLTAKLLLQQLLPRTIRTKAEILKDLNGFYDMNAEDSFYDDAFEELLDETGVQDALIVVDSFTAGGKDGYVLKPRGR